MILRINFIKYGYKEAVEEGLKENILGGSEGLWNSDGGAVSNSVLRRVSKYR